MNKRDGKDLEVTDYELVRRCLSGRRDNFSEIVRRYKKLVYSTIYNFTDESSDISDVFQEVFIKIYKSLTRYNPTYRFSTWVIKITTNQCLDRLRQKGLGHVPLEDAEDIVDCRLNPEDHYLAKERLESIRRAVRELPEEYRVPVVLFHQQGLSYEALVDVIGQPMTIVKNRLYRARLMLKDKLNPQGKKENCSC